MLLNEITHKEIASEVDSLIKSCNNEKIILDAAVLFESGMDRICDYTIAVIAPKDDRLKRVMLRDMADENSVLARMQSQNDDVYYTNKADATIVNDGDLKDLYKKMAKVLAEVGCDKD